MNNIIYCVGLGISFSAFLLSVLTSFYVFKQKRLKPEILLDWVAQAGKSQNNFCFTIYNPSSVVQAITKISINKAVAIKYPVKLISNMEDTKRVFSDGMPINVLPNRAQKFVAVFQNVSSKKLDKSLSIDFLINNRNQTFTTEVLPKLINLDQLAIVLMQRLK